MQETKRKKVGELLVSLGHITLQQLSEGLEKHHETGETLGSIFIKLGMIREETLYEVLSQQIESEHRQKVGEILVSYGYITQEQLEQALAEQQKTRKRLGEILEALGFIDEEKIIDVLSAQLDIPHTVLEGYPFQKEVVTLLPSELALHYKMIPLFRQGNVLVLATADPTNLRNLDHVKFKTGLDIEPMLATEKSILDAIHKCYGDVFVDDKKTQPDIVAQIPEKKENVEEVKNVKTEDRIQVRTLVYQFITQAIQEGATDIHVEPSDRGVRVRNRIRGELKESKPLDMALYPQIILRIKAMAGIEATEKAIPQKGRFRIRMQGKDVSLRISFFPCLDREHQTVQNMVIRIQDSQPGDFELEKLSMHPQTLDLLKKAVMRPGGILLVSGPEASGKTTTLYSILRFLNRPQINIYTIEETVEMHLEGVHQSQIKPSEGFNFADGLSWILHQDPDVVMLGDLSDAKTFETAVSAAQNGVRVFASFKAEDFNHALSRLFSMGVEPALISSSLTGILAQRMIRKICTYCREAFEPPTDLLNHFHFPPKTTLFHGKGCEICGRSGYKDKVGLFEMALFTPKARLTLLGKNTPEEIKKSMDKKNFISIYQDGLYKCIEGITTLEQIMGASNNLFASS